jgi:hypothetical protein
MVQCYGFYGDEGERGIPPGIGVVMRFSGRDSSSEGRDLNPRQPAWKAGTYRT